MATPLMKLPNTMKAAGAAALGAVLFGAEIGYWSQANSMASFNKIMTGSQSVEPSANELTWVTMTLYLVGFFFALPPVTKIFAGGIGRRKTLILSGILFSIAMALQASAGHLSYPASKAMLWSGRALLGVPVAFCVTTSPMFLAEVSPKEHRGFIGGLFQFTLMVFFVLASGIGWAVKSNFPDSKDAVQYAIWWMVPLGLLVSATMYCSNETPQFLILSGKEDEAEKVIFYLRKGADEKYTRNEFQLMQEEIAAEKALGDVNLKNLFSGFPLRIVMITILMQFFNQLTGMNVLNNFAPKIYGSVFTTQGNMLAFVGTVIQLLATVPSCLLSDRVGRRPLLIGGGAVLALAWGGIGILGATVFHHPDHCFKISDGIYGGTDARFTSKAMGIEYWCGPIDTVNTTYATCSEEVSDSFVKSDTFNLECLSTGDGAPTASDPQPNVESLYAYMFLALSYVINFVFSFTVGPIAWSYNAEIAPNKIRAQLVGISAASNMILNAFTISPAMGILISSLGFNAFWLFAVVSVLACCVFYWIVETKGLSLEVVTEKWEKKLNCKYTDLHHTENGSLDTDSSGSDEEYQA